MAQGSLTNSVTEQDGFYDKVSLAFCWWFRLDIDMTSLVVDRRAYVILVTTSQATNNVSTANHSKMHNLFSCAATLWTDLFVCLFVCWSVCTCQVHSHKIN